MPWDLTSEITAQRDAAEMTFPGTCVISRMAEVPDGQGGLVQSWAAVGTVNCRIVSNTSMATVVASQNMGDYTLTVPHDTVIYFEDKVTLDGFDYRVTFVDDARAWKTAIRVQISTEVDS